MRRLLTSAGVGLVIAAAVILAAARVHGDRRRPTTILFDVPGVRVRHVDAQHRRRFRLGSGRLRRLHDRGVRGRRATRRRPWGELLDAQGQ